MPWTHLNRWHNNRWFRNSLNLQYHPSEDDGRTGTTRYFDPPHHKLKPGIQSKLDALLKEYETQFVKDETSIGTPLTEMTIDTGDSEPISQKPYPIAMKN